MLNPFLPNVFFHSCRSDESVSNFRVVGWHFSRKLLYKNSGEPDHFSKKLLYKNSGEPDQTPRCAASDLIMHCLSMSHKKDDRHIWVKDDTVIY